MRLAILSDVHANYYALKRTLDNAQDNQVTDYIFLGDLVGYGSLPLDCFELMDSLDIKSGHWLVGNHDLMANGEATIQLNWVNSDAKLTLTWFQQQESFSTERNQELYRRFQARTKDCPTFGNSPHIAGLWLMHGVSTENDRTGYDNLFSRESYIGNQLPDVISERLERSYQFACQQNDEPPRLMVGGHSHIASLWKRIDKGCWEKQPIKGTVQTNRELWTECPKCHGQGHCGLWQATEPINLAWEPIYINPGSVGQPRDGCPAISMAIVDVSQNNVQFWRLDYNYRRSYDDLIRMVDYDKRNHDQMESVVDRLQRCLKNGFYQK